MCTWEVAGIQGLGRVDQISGYKSTTRYLNASYRM